MSFQPVSFPVKESKSNQNPIESKEKEVSRRNRASLLPGKVSPLTLQKSPELEKKRSSVFLSPKQAKDEGYTEAQTVSQYVRRNSLAPRRSVGGSSFAPVMTRYSSTMSLSLHPTKKPSQRDVKKSMGNSSLHFDVKAIFMEKMEELSMRLLAFQKEMQAEVKELDEMASLEDKLLVEKAREQFKDRLKFKWEILRGEFDDLLSAADNEGFDSRLVSKIDLDSLGFNEFFTTGRKESLKLSPASKKSLKHERHLVIAHDCFKEIILIPVENGFYFEDKENIKKLMKLFPQGNTDNPRLLLAKYIEGLTELGRVLKEEYLELQKSSKELTNKPILAYARGFFAKHIHQYLTKELKKEQSEDKKAAIAGCCQEFGDCIIAYAGGLKKQEMDQISEAARSLMAYFIKTAEFKQEGIFRQSGIKLITDQLVMKLQKSSSFDISSLKPTTNDMAVALKELFGMMQLFASPELEDQFIQLGFKITQSAEELSEEELIRELKSLIAELSPDQQQDLKQMFDILGQASTESEVNKMTPKNLSIVFGPRLCSPADPQKTVSAVDPINNVTMNLLIHRDQIFS